MKFFLINKTAARLRRWQSDFVAWRRRSRQIAAYLRSGSIHGAWVVQSGGHAYIFNVGNGEVLASEFRFNSLTKRGQNEVILVEDAVSFLARCAEDFEAPSLGANKHQLQRELKACGQCQQSPESDGNTYQI